MRAVIQIIACAPSPVVYATCGAAVAGLTLATGGSLGDAAKAVAFSFASMGIFDQIGLAFGDLGAMIKEVGVVGASVLKGGVHGVVGGALSLAQGGSFQEGFAANAIGAVTGVLTGAMQIGNMIADTAIVAAAGCAGAVLSGGKCATGAITAAFANMYNKWEGSKYLWAGAEVGVSFVPGIGELQDLTVIFGSSSTLLERGLATASLGLNIATLGLAPNAGGFIRGARYFCSFEGDTEVQTQLGFVPIKEIEPGTHKVWARDEKNGDTGFKPVEVRYWNPYDETVTLKIRDEETGEEHTILSNRIHPFYVGRFEPIVRLVENGSSEIVGTNATGEWIKAENLEPGHRLLDGDGTWSEIVSKKIEKKPLQAYNLHVSDFHTFFVRGPDNDNAAPVWVHNSKYCDFGHLKDHFGRHGSELGVGSADEYLAQAAKNMASGKAFKFRHDGAQKSAHITRMGPDKFMFTSSTQSGGRAFTHMAVDRQYLRNNGITLPNGF